MYSARYNRALQTDIPDDCALCGDWNCYLISCGSKYDCFPEKLLRPLEQLKDEADAISQGQYQRQIDVKGKDELASLSHSFNTMAKAVESHIAEVEETSEARNRLIHALSHEMRTPVTAICGYAYSLRNMKLTDAQKQEALEFMDIEAKRLGSLSGKLTALVGLTADKIELKDIELEELKNILR